jgi:molecular chaperone HscB
MKASSSAIRERKTAVAAESLSGFELEVNFESDDFTLFNVPQRFEQTQTQLHARWRELQTLVHPDRFASEGESAQRLAMQWAVRVNEAYQRLKNPLKRAAYLCQLNGVQIEAENNTAMPADFLMRQIEWREALEDAADQPTELGQLANRLRDEQASQLQALGHLLDVQRDFVQAAQAVRALMFYESLKSDLKARSEAVQSEGSIDSRTVTKS